MIWSENRADGISSRSNRPLLGVGTVSSSSSGSRLGWRRAEGRRKPAHTAGSVLERCHGKGTVPDSGAQQKNSSLASRVARVEDCYTCVTRTWRNWQTRRT